MEIGLQFIFNKKEHVCIERWGAGGGGGGRDWRAKYMTFCSRVLPPVERHEVIFNLLLR